MEGTVKVVSKNIELGALDINIVGRAMWCQVTDVVLTIDKACTHEEWMASFVMKFMFRKFDNDIAELIAMYLQEYLEHNVTFSFRRLER